MEKCTGIHEDDVLHNAHVSQQQQKVVDGGVAQEVVGLGTLGRKIVPQGRVHVRWKIAVRVTVHVHQHGPI